MGRTDMTLRAEGRGGPARSVADAHAEAQSEHDQQLADIESFFASGNGEVYSVVAEADDTWEEGAPPNTQFFTRIESVVNGYILQDSLSTAGHTVTDSTIAAPLAASAAGDSRFRSLVRSVLWKPPHFFHLEGDFDIVEAEAVVDFGESHRLPNQVSRYERSYDNRKAQTDFEWNLVFDETVTEEQTISLTKMVSTAKKYKVSVKYKSATIGGDFEKRISVTQVSAHKVIGRRHVRESFSSKVPAGTLRTIGFEVVSGRLSVPLRGRITFDAQLTSTRPIRPLARARTAKLSELLSRSERTSSLEGVSVFGTFTELRMTTVDE